MTAEQTDRPPLELSPEQERRVWRLIRETLQPPQEERSDGDDAGPGVGGGS